MENNEQKNNEFLNQKRQKNNPLPFLSSKDKIENFEVNKNDIPKKDKIEESICHCCKIKDDIIEIKKLEDIFKYLKRVNLFKPEYLDFEKKNQELEVNKYLCKNCINKINLSNNGGINYIINILDLNIGNNLNKNEKKNLQNDIITNYSNLSNLLNLLTNNRLNLFNQINNLNNKPRYQNLNFSNINNFNFFSNQLNQNNRQNNFSQPYIHNNCIIPNLMNLPSYNSNNLPLNEQDINLISELRKQINMMELCNQFQKNSLDNISQNLNEFYTEIFNQKRLNNIQKQKIILEKNNQMKQNINNNIINNNNYKKI